MPLPYKTPGVYIQELNAFPNSVVSVETAIPAFIGYTEKAKWNKKELTLKPAKISSISEYVQFFGGAPKTKFNVSGTPSSFQTEAILSTRFLLYDSLRFFFMNGGGSCYIVSVGNYDYSSGVEKSKLEQGIEPLEKEQEPTMLVVPDAVLVSDETERNDLMQQMLGHCGEQQNRIAILDVANGFNQNFQNDITSFRNGVGSQYLQWGAAYFPWLNTTVVDSNELDYTNIESGLTDLLTSAINDQLSKGEIKEEKAKALKDEVAKMSKKDNDAATIKASHQTLYAMLPIYKEVVKQMATQLNLLPPSGAMAGIYTMVDNSQGVWKAPANVSVAGVISPSVNITHEDQEDLNAPLNGKAVNAIRTFIGQGVLVWGARTLDGNSLDYRYVNVRRTLIFIEQSIKFASRAYVFEPNVAGTWIVVKSMIENFLNDVWKQGGLAGSTPSDAFNVQVGLGATMTPDDILEGIMRVTVTVAISRPAEFIIITFEQQMQKS